MPLTRPPSTIILNPNLDFGNSERLGKNKIINGNFDFWQRASSLAITGSEYVADRWLSHEGTSGVATISRQLFSLGQTDVPNNPEYYMRHDQTTGGTGDVGFEQRIEDVRTLNGQSLTVSFWAKVGSGSMDVTPKLVQNFGTTGSPSTSVITAESAISIDTLWKKYLVTFALPSINGKVLGSDNNDFLSIQLLTPVSTIFTLDVAQIQLEKGLIATEYDNRPLGYELSLCQRYYEKSYNVDVNPGTTTNVGSITILAQTTTTLAAKFRSKLIEKKTTPTIIWYSPGTGANGKIRNFSDNVDETVTAITDTGNRSTGYPTVSLSGFKIYKGHYTADAEL